MPFISINKPLYCVMILVIFKETVCKVVDQDANRFILVRKSSAFVDKTVLLKNIFKYDFLLLTAPRKFGKTTNLHMIKLFLSINYKRVSVADVFRNTNIWQDRKFLVKHLNQYPVIYCNFRPKGLIKTFEDVLNELKMSVRDAFVEHKYLLNSSKFSLPTKQQFVRYCRLEVKEFEVGLKFLSGLLCKYHGKKVTVLIDDYDNLITNSIFIQELDSTKTAHVLFRIIDNTINLNEDFVEKCVVMGRLPFKLGAQFSGLYLLEHFKFLETKDFTPFFGFTQRETFNLLNKFGLGKFMQNVSTWYGGYSYLHGNFHIYNPWSVLNFMKSMTFDTHWVCKTSKKMLYDYIAPHYELKNDFSQLVERKHLKIRTLSSFTTYEVEKLKNVQFASYSYTEDQTEDHLFLQVLLESGYLTYAETHKSKPISTKVKFPNIEIQKVFEQVLMRLAAVNPDIDRY